jgi:hypothetical protein
MKYTDITEELKTVSFEYFYWFSRFEFVLKEYKILKSEGVGESAEPSWEKFSQAYSKDYIITDSGNRLIELHPKRQVVAHNQELEWRPVGLDHCTTDLCRIKTMLTTIRNNLFHGGKHGDTDQDSIARNIDLLKTAKTVLDELASQFNFENDYQRQY